MSDHVVVAHGMSEVDLFMGVMSAIGQPPVIYSRDGGRRNIAMSHLPDVFTHQPFDSEPSLHRWAPGLGYAPRGRPRFPGLKVFPIMDYDGDDRNLVSYVTGNLLRSVPLAGYVVPILNYPNLEGVMAEMGYDVSGIDKGDYYKDFVRDLRRRDGLSDFYHRVRDCGDTNMDHALFHLMGRVPCFQDALDPPRDPVWSFMRGA